jgi:hypothetical protein
MEHLCKTCKGKIPDERVALGYKDTCVKHSEEKAYYGLMEYGHKTAGYAVIVKPSGDAEKDNEIKRRMRRAFERGR